MPPAPDAPDRPATPLRLRLATPADGAACAAVYGPYVRETAISFELEPPDAVEMSARIARTTERMPWVVAEIDGVIRGYAYAGRWRERAAYGWTGESAVYVDGEHRGLGIGRSSMRALLAILRAQGFHSVVAGVTAPNPASVALHVSLGFTRVGNFEAVGWKHGGWHGVEWFGLELAERAAPNPIRPLPVMLDAPEVLAALRDCANRLTP